MARNIVWTPDTEEAGGYVKITNPATGEVTECLTSTAVCDAMAAGIVEAEEIPAAGAYALGMWARYDWYYGPVGDYRKTGQSEAASADTVTLLMVFEARARSIAAIEPENADLAKALDKLVEACRNFCDARMDSRSITEALAVIAKNY